MGEWKNIIALKFIDRLITNGPSLSIKPLSFIFLASVQQFENDSFADMMHLNVLNPVAHELI